MLKLYKSTRLLLTYLCAFLFIKIFLSSQLQANPDLINTIGKSRQLDKITAIKVDKLGNAYIFENLSDKTAVKKINNQGNLISELTLSQANAHSFAVNSKGEFYTAFLNQKTIISKWTAAGDLILRWKIPIQDYYTKIAIDSKNNVYVKFKNSIKIYNENGLLIQELNGYFKGNSPNTIYPFPNLWNIEINGNDTLLLTKEPLKAEDPLSFILMNNKGKLIKSFKIDEKNIYAIAHDKNNFIYASVPKCGCIHQFNTSGSLIKVIGKKGSKRGQLLYPTQIELDNSGNLTVVEDNYRIQRFNSTGVALWTYGDQLGYLKNITGLATDSQENIYILDYGHYRIQKFSPDGSFLKAWGSYGLKQGEFTYLNGIKVSPDDKIYVKDSYQDISNTTKNRVQVFSSEGLFLENYNNTLPNFDKQNNRYHINKKLNSTNQYFSYFLQKTDANGNIKEWGLNNLTGSPCTDSMVFDSQSNIYLLTCSIWNNYNENSIKRNRTLMSGYSIYINKINSEDGSLLQSQIIDTGEGTVDYYDLAIDKNDLIYVKNFLTYSSNYTSAPFAIDTDLQIVGPLKIMFYRNILSSGNHLYLTSPNTDFISAYDLPSTLRAPFISTIDKLPRQGELEIKWQDRTDNETGFKLKRCTGESCNNFETIATLAANTTSVKLLKPSNFTPGVIYRFRLTTLKDDEESLADYDAQISF